jgi:hypothetical protein
MSTLSGSTKAARAAGFIFAATAALSGISAALADDAKPASDSQVCIEAREIDHTKVLNDHQILFYMTGHKVWVNNLPNKCSALRYDEGFVWVSSNPQYCDNLETIKVRPTGQPCLLGKFSPYQKSAR